VGSLAAGGCGEIPGPPPAKSAPGRPAASAQAPAAKAPAAKPAAAKPRSTPPAAARPQEELDLIAKAYEATRSAGGGSSIAPAGGGEDEHVRKVSTAIRASLEVGPTAVVWLLDRSPSAESLVGQTVAAARDYYASAELRTTLADPSRPLVTAVAKFADDVQFVLDPPTSEVAKIREALGAVERSTSSRENTFAALQQAVENATEHETLIPILRRHAIPLYVIGLPAPWGQINPFAFDPKDATKLPADDSVPVVGPESWFSERVDVQWAAGSLPLELVDSGYGPFALERLCRASRGAFLAVRGGGSFRTWPTGSELQFDPQVRSKYAPDYVSLAEYQKLLAENKARAALHAAAKLPPVTIDGSPITRFPKEADAQMARRASEAQQFSARNLAPIQQLFELLTPGEADREKLSSARWQAEFDLALGRVLAAKVRLDGYNSMIAALKRGKTFTKESSRSWVLEPADAFETESTLRRAGERAKMYLERVAKEHPGTPWAAIAAEELKTPLGWTWREE
jgi:hypothetical protein